MKEHDMSHSSRQSKGMPFSNNKAKMSHLHGRNNFPNLLSSEEESGTLF